MGAFAGVVEVKNYFWSFASEGLITISFAVLMSSLVTGCTAFSELTAGKSEVLNDGKSYTPDANVAVGAISASTAAVLMIFFIVIVLMFAREERG